MNILKEIIDKKKEEVDLDKKNNSLEKVKKLITKKNFSFKKQLSLFKELKKIALIAEVKKLVHQKVFSCVILIQLRLQSSIVSLVLPACQF